MKKTGMRPVRIKGVVIGYVLVLFFVSLSMGYAGFPYLLNSLFISPEPTDAGTMGSVAFWLNLFRKQPIYWLAPTYAIILIIWGSFFYRSLQNRLSLLSAPASPESDARPQSHPSQPTVDREFQENHDRRLFLHLLGLFQREGRLVDFFHENLDDYDDAQIGAAVRSIHESCRKVMDRFVKVQPVLEQEEGASISLSRGFDAHTIKLIGNVGGEPPFHGIIRHRGWKARKKDIPELSGNPDSTLIVPAEVELS